MKWISVEDELPDVGVEVFASYYDKNVWVARRKDINEEQRKWARKHKDKWPVDIQFVDGSLVLYDITHWMAIPEQPRMPHCKCNCGYCNCTMRCEDCVREY